MQTDLTATRGSQTLSVQIFIDQQFSDSAFAAMEKIQDHAALFETYYSDNIDALGGVDAGTLSVSFANPS